MQGDDIADIIGMKVRAGRARLRLTRKQLAAIADVSERYLNELENGGANASVGVLARIAEALGQDVASLVSVAGPGAGAENLGRPMFAGLQDVLATMTIPEQEAVTPVVSKFIEDRRRASKGLALIGLRGAGKSTLGGRLAERHGLPFVSVTREIEARAGMSLPDLFNLGGPDAYRSLENDVLSEIIRGEGPIVLETAGGIVSNSQALDLILSAFKTVWLKASPEEHLARVAGQGDTRPMRGDPKALEHLKALLKQREPDYARAECVIDTAGRTIDQCLTDLEAIAAPMLALRAG